MNNFNMGKFSEYIKELASMVKVKNEAEARKYLITKDCDEEVVNDLNNLNSDELTEQLIYIIMSNGVLNSINREE